MDLLEDMVARKMEEDKDRFPRKVSGGEVTLTPCIGFNEVGDRRLYLQDPGSEVFLRRTLRGNRGPAEAAAHCTFRMKRVESGKPDCYRTCFFVAPEVVVVPDEALPSFAGSKTETGLDDLPDYNVIFQKLGHCVIVDAFPATNEVFQRCEAPRAYLDTTASRDPSAPVRFLKVKNEGKTMGKCGFLLPASIEYASRESGVLGVVGFSMSDEFLANCNWARDRALSQEEERVLKEYMPLVEALLRRELCCYTDKDEFVGIVLRKLSGLLHKTFGKFVTGEPTCSVGTVRKILDGTRMGVNYSTLEGSQGAPVFCLDLPRGVFVGVDIGPDDSEDYNVMISTDSPDFVKMYVRDVLPRLPDPSVLFQKDEERLRAFQHYLRKHSGFIMDSRMEVTEDGAWGSGQSSWLNWAGVTN